MVLVLVIMKLSPLQPIQIQPNKYLSTVYHTLWGLFAKHYEEHKEICNFVTCNLCLQLADYVGCISSAQIMTCKAKAMSQVEVYQFSKKV